MTVNYALLRTTQAGVWRTHCQLPQANWVYYHAWRFVDVEVAVVFNVSHPCQASLDYGAESVEALQKELLLV